MTSAIFNKIAFRKPVQICQNSVSNRFCHYNHPVSPNKFVDRNLLTNLDRLKMGCGFAIIEIMTTVVMEIHNGRYKKIQNVVKNLRDTKK